jgi:hypothetical protein
MKRVCLFWHTLFLVAQMSSPLPLQYQEALFRRDYEWGEKITYDEGIVEFHLGLILEKIAS